MSLPALDDGSGSRARVRLPVITVPKGSDVLAHELRERILTGAFAQGVGLPAERTLVEQTGMSRTTVREALRILEVQGLVTIRAGRTGGAFVQQPGEQAMANTVDLLIRGRRIQLAALLETRETIEPYCAQLAAVGRTDADVLAISAALERMGAERDRVPEFIAATVEWHVAVARATHNELLSGLMAALSRSIFESSNDEEFVQESVRAEAIRAHSRITDAVIAQEPEAAMRRMRRHVRGYASAVADSER